MASDVLLAVIGKDWLTMEDENGERRIDNPYDFVRLEISTALHFGKIVIPVLVDSASIPTSAELPADLRPITRRNAATIGHQSFNVDAQRLISALQLLLNQVDDERKREVDERRQAEVDQKRRVAGEPKHKAEAAKKRRQVAEDKQKTEAEENRKRESKEEWKAEAKRKAKTEQNQTLSRHQPDAHPICTPNRQAPPIFNNPTHEKNHQPFKLWKYVVFFVFPILLFPTYYYFTKYDSKGAIETEVFEKIQTSLLPTSEKPNSNLPASAFQHSRQFSRKSVAVAFKSDLLISYVSQPTTTKKANPTDVTNKYPDDPRDLLTKCKSIAQKSKYESPRFTLSTNPNSTIGWTAKSAKTGTHPEGYCVAGLYPAHRHLFAGEKVCHNQNNSIVSRTIYCYRKDKSLSSIYYSAISSDRSNGTHTLYFDASGNKIASQANSETDTLSQYSKDIAIHMTLDEFKASVGL